MGESGSSELQALRRLFGFKDFRPGQAEAVGAALSGRDALVVMPTGSGKSLCYQLPALMRADLTVVVSPLVSLMQDQVSALSAIAPGRVEAVNAQRGRSANNEAMARVRGGDVRLLYVAPERFGSPGFAAALAGTSIGLFVVDEAHCVSQWGHDFRPDYFALAGAAARLRARSVLALTATATPRVADDIARRLALREPARITTGFDRPNLSFAVVHCRGADQERRLAASLARPGALPAIVYAGTRQSSEQLARALTRALGCEAVAYHAGMDRGRRSEVQERFMRGEAPVIVATNAFGMGIDKPDVRTVCHGSVPGSLEAYYQEAGRAGRDGHPARCLLFAEQRDKGLHVFFIQRSRLPDGALVRVARWLESRARPAEQGQMQIGLEGARAADTADALADGGHYDVALSELAPLTSERGRDEDSVRAAIGHLARAGVLAPAPSAPDRAAGRMTGGWTREAAAACLASARDAERVRWSQYRAIWAYVEGNGCRRRALLAHFGDRRPSSSDVPCCDVCEPGLVADLGPARGARPRAAPRAGTRRRPPARESAPQRAPAGVPAPGELDRAILDVVCSARPPVGRTRAVEILRGGRSKVVVQYSYDGLAEYGAFAHLRSEDVLGRVDELLREGRLRSTGGRFPKLAAA